MKPMNDQSKGRVIRRIAFMIGQLGYGGSEKQLYYLLKHLDRSRFNAQLWVVSGGGVWERSIRELGIEIIDLGKYSKLFRPFVVYMLTRREKLDVWWSWSYFTNLYAHFVPPTVKRIGMLRIALQFARRDVGKLYALYERSLDLLFCNSESVLREVIAAGYRGEATWIGNIIDPVITSNRRRLQFRKDAGCDENDILIVGVGSMYKRKNYSALLASISALPENTRLAIIGDGPERNRLEKECRNLAITHRVWMPGNIPNGAEIISYADIFVHPSTSEGMSNVVLEAAIAGVPIVVTNVDGIHEILNENDAKVIPINDVNSLTCAIRDTITNYREAKEIAARLKERISTKFRPDYVVSKLESWIDWLAGDVPRPEEFSKDL